MTMWMKRLALVVLVILMGMPSFSTRAEEFVAPDSQNLMKLLLRFGSLDPRRDDVIDLYGRAMACQIYLDYHGNDFQWQKVRGVLRDDIKNNIDKFPTGIRFNASLQLGQYDFKEKIFRFSKKTAQFNVNVFTLKASKKDFCTEKGIYPFPKEIKVVLEQPILVTGLTIGEKDGGALLDRLKASGNKDLVIYTSFNMRSTYIPPVLQSKKVNGKDEVSFSDVLRVDAILDSIEYYEDKERTKLLYRYMP